jgi:resuscitation-promoting factor RpfB
MKKLYAILLSWLLTVPSVIFPSLSWGIHTKEETNKETNKVRKETKWTKSLSKYYAKALISAQYEEWDRSEYKALLKLWGKESAWNHTAANPKSSAYGIPQLLKMKPGTPAPVQIARGLAYIKHRYDKPSIAWAHWRKHNWY